MNAHVCSEPNNSAAKKSCPTYSDDEENPESMSMFIRQKCLAEQPAPPKDINELKEKSRDLENELAKLRNEFNETNDVYEHLKNVSSPPVSVAEKAFPSVLPLTLLFILFNRRRTQTFTKRPPNSANTTRPSRLI